MALRLASLFVSLGADTTKLESGFRRGEQRGRRFERRMNSIGQSIQRGLNRSLIATAATAVANIAIYQRNAAAIDSIGKASTRLGESVENLQALQRAAELSGVSARAAEIGFQRMTRRVADAAQGSGVLVKALDDLNLDAAELATQNPAAQFEAISNAISEIPSQAERVRLAFSAFDSEGVGLLNLLPSSLRDARDEMQRLNIELARSDVVGIERANDAISILRQNATGVTRVFAASFAPAIQTISELVNDQIATTIDWGAAFDSVARIGVRAIGLYVDGLVLINRVATRARLGIANLQGTIFRAIDSVVGSDNTAAAVERAANSAADIRQALEELTDRNLRNTLVEDFDRIRAENVARAAEFESQIEERQAAIQALRDAQSNASAPVDVGQAAGNDGLQRALDAIERTREGVQETSQGLLFDVSNTSTVVGRAIAAIDETRNAQLETLNNAAVQLGLDIDTLESLERRIDDSFNGRREAIRNADRGDLSVVAANVIQELTGITENQQQLNDAATQGLATSLEALDARAAEIGLAGDAFAEAERRLVTAFQDRTATESLAAVQSQVAAFEEIERESLTRLQAFRAEFDPSITANAAFTDQITQLRGFLDQRLVTEAEYYSLFEQAQRDHQSRLVADQSRFQQQWSAFQQAGAVERFQILGQEFSGSLQAFAQHSRAFFELNKTAGFANAVINTAQGVTEALKLPFPASLGAAAVVGLNGAAQIAAISNQSFGSRGSVPQVSQQDVTSGSNGIPESDITPGANQVATTTIVNVLTADEIIDQERFAQRTLATLSQAQETQDLIAPGLVVNSL